MREAIKACPQRGTRAGRAVASAFNLSPYQVKAPPRPIRRHHMQSAVISRHQPSSRGVPSGGASPPNQTSSYAISRHQPSSAVISRHQPSSRGVPSGGASPPNRLLHRPAHDRYVTTDGIFPTRCKGAREVGDSRLEGGLRWLSVLFGAQADDGDNQRGH